MRYQRSWACAAVLGFFALGCRHVPISNGESHGPVVAVKDWFTSSFVVTLPEGGVVLIDAGFDGNAKPLLNELAARGVDSSEVKVVLLTHAHRDHIGGLPAFPSAEVWGLAGMQDVDLDRELTDGEVFEIGGETFEVFAVPGHAPGNGVFLVGGVLIMGDSAMARRDGGLETVPARYSDDPERARQSLVQLTRRLADRSETIEAIWCSHSGPARDPSAASSTSSD